MRPSTCCSPPTAGRQSTPQMYPVFRCSPASVAHLCHASGLYVDRHSIESKLAAGTTLVCDRYAHSGVAFSAAKGLGMEWCMTPDERLPAPDCVIFLDIEPEAAAQRGEYGAERYEKLDFQHKVRGKFQELRSRISAERGEEDVAWHILDATKPIDVLQEEIRQISSRVVAEVAGKPIRRLWSGRTDDQVIS